MQYSRSVPDIFSKVKELVMSKSDAEALSVMTAEYNKIRDNAITQIETGIEIMEQEAKNKDALVK